MFNRSSRGASVSKAVVFGVVALAASQLFSPFSFAASAPSEPATQTRPKAYTKAQQFGTAYFRFGGGVAFQTPYHHAFGSAADSSKDTGFSGVSGIFNADLGVNRYSGAFFIGFGIGMDMMIQDRYHNHNVGFGGTDVSGFILDAKIKLGFNIVTGSARTALYVLAGGAVDLGQPAADGSVFVAGGPVAGLGLTIGSKRAPFAMYVEASVPLFINSVEPHSAAGANANDYYSIVTIAPKVVAGIQIGY